MNSIPKFTPRNYLRFVREVFHEGEGVSDPAAAYIEVRNAAFKITNPLDRLVVSSVRKINFPFAVAEWVGLMTGGAELPLYTKFIKSYGKYSSDGSTVDGAYGPRIAGTGQLMNVIDELMLSPASRRAVMTIYSGRDLRSKSLSIPCTLTLQFLRREEKLHLTVNMRSNDVILGLPYDIFQFTMLQEFVARWTGLELGEYVHQAGSMHLYVRDSGIATTSEEWSRWPGVMEPMPKGITLLDLQILRSFISNLNDDPTRGKATLLKAPSEDSYLRNFYLACDAFVIRKTAPSLAEEMVACITDPIIRKVMRPWLE